MPIFSQIETNVLRILVHLEVLVSTLLDLIAVFVPLDICLTLVSEHALVSISFKF
jgi:hypothetical protein